MRVLLTRPQTDSVALGTVLEGMGIKSTISPLLEIIYEDGPELNLAGVGGLLFTSANGVRAFIRRSNERNILALAVGDATGRELEQSGFKNISSAGGNVETLSALASKTLNPNGGSLLHPAGSRLAGDLEGMVTKAGFTYRREIMYRAATPDVLPHVAMDAIENNNIDGVLFYSPRTAKTFAKLVKAAGLEAKLKNITAYCLSNPVGAMVDGMPWKDIKIAPKPEQGSLLGLL